MHALIMAAGRGSRLGSHTEERPKALVDLGGISPLEWQLDLLASRGVERVVIVTGYRAPAVVAVAQRRAAGRLAIEVVWNPFWPITNVASSAWFARDRLSDSFVYLHADTIFHPSILDEMLASPGSGCLPVDFRECEPEQMKARVVDGCVMELSKELPDSLTAGEFIGIGLFRTPAVDPVRTGLDAVVESGNFSAYFEAALNIAIADGLALDAIPVRERVWAEIDFPEDLAYARSILRQLTVA